MKRWLKIVAGALLALLIVAALLLFTPLVDPDLSARPEPMRSYDAASSRIEQIQAEEEAQDLIPQGKSIALLTGSQENTAVVVFHGYTSVPAQFRVIAQGYRDQGYNVWVPRLPYHGESDKMTRDFSKITERVARDFADDNIDIARGLGKNVVVIGLSGGGSLGVWAGAERKDVAQTVLISPVLHPLGLPEWADRPVARALRISPVDVYRWWDEDKKADNVEGYNYPRLSLGGLAAMLSLTHFVEDRVGDSGKPVTTKTLLIRNNGDQRLDSAYNERFVKRVVAPGSLDIFRIPASAGLLHNFVSVEPYSESYPNIRTAYGYLSDALGIPLPDPLAPSREASGTP
jgi:carboxylesterase